jgi:hypothetical protein
MREPHAKCVKITHPGGADFANFPENRGIWWLASAMLQEN